MARNLIKAHDKVKGLEWTPTYFTPETKYQTRFHIPGAATVDPVAVDLSTQRIGHAAGTDGVHMRVEHQGSAAATATHDADDIRATGSGFLHQQIGGPPPCGQ